MPMVDSDVKVRRNDVRWDSDDPLLCLQKVVVDSVC